MMEQQANTQVNGKSSVSETGVKNQHQRTSSRNSRPKQNKVNRSEGRGRYMSDSDATVKLRNQKQTTHSRSRERFHKGKALDQIGSQEGCTTKVADKENFEDLKTSDASKGRREESEKLPFRKRRVFTRRHASDSNAELQKAGGAVACDVGNVHSMKGFVKNQRKKLKSEGKAESTVERNIVEGLQEGHAVVEIKDNPLPVRKKRERRGSKSGIRTYSEAKLWERKKNDLSKKESEKEEASTKSLHDGNAASASSGEEHANMSTLKENGAGDAGVHAVIDSQAPEHSAQNFNVTQPHDHDHKKQSGKDKQSFTQRQSRPRWLRPYVPLPFSIGGYGTEVLWPKNNISYGQGRKGLPGTRYNPYRIEGNTSGTWNSSSGTEPSKTWTQKSSYYQHDRWRHFPCCCHCGQLPPTDCYQPPEHGSASFPTRFSDQRRSKKKVYRSRNRPRNNDTKDASKSSCPPAQDTKSDELLKLPANSESQESSRDDNVTREEFPLTAVNNEVAAPAESKNAPEIVPKTDTEPLSIVTTEDDGKLISGTPSITVIENGSCDETGDDVSPHSRSVEDLDFGAISDAITKDIEEVADYRVNRLLHVMMDLLHPDGRSLLDCIRVSHEDFYRLCSRFAMVEFNELRDLDISNIDEGLLHGLYEELGWICRSILVPLLSEKALLANSLIDFSRLDLDIFQSEGMDPYKELSMLFTIADDFRNVAELAQRDTHGWLDQCHIMKEMLEAFMKEDKQLLKQLGVSDTAESVTEKIELGMAISDKDVTSMLRESMNSDFGDYTWLVENHPHFIRTTEHFDCIMESISQMEKCVDIRPLKRTLTIIPSLLSGLSPDQRDSCVARHLGRHELLKAARSWVEPVRNAESMDQLVMELTTQFLFCSLECGAEELLGVLLENIPLDRKIEAIKCIDLLPPSLLEVLRSDLSNKASLYSATKQMAEQMPAVRFKKDAVFLISNLCEYSFLSPSILLSKVFFPMMSTPAKAKAALTISSLLKHKKFKSELLEGSTISVSDLLTFALQQYEAPSKTMCTSRYIFIESVFRAVQGLLSDEPSFTVDMNEIFKKFPNITWYQKLVISRLLCHGIGHVPIEYPWNESGNSVKNLQTLNDLPLILTSWPGDNSRLFENFIEENFDANDVDILSQVMILSLDGDEERMKEDIHVFASSIYAISNVSYDWEKLLSDSEKKNETRVSGDDGAQEECLSCTSRTVGRPTRDDGRMPSNDEHSDRASLSTEIHTDGTGSSCEISVNRLSGTGGEPSEKFRPESVPLQSVSSEAQKYDIQAHKQRDPEFPISEGAPEDLDGRDVMETEDDDIVNACLLHLLNQLDMDKIEEWSSLLDDKPTEYSALHSIAKSVSSSDEQCTKSNDTSTETSGGTPPSCSQQGGIETLKKQVLHDDADWVTEEIIEWEVSRDEILQDLRTYTWALDTLEKWFDCPLSAREKVLLMALSCRCYLVKARAVKMKGNPSLST
ncbi:hypothetical protein GCK32_006033 [Trichostrongylus colubriformis]|uniref:Uncharacterized protein n=1 Tax=Trichostrongylus colubriformis TaxID=6319 RepID=A0AAN8FZN4_TRICO